MVSALILIECTHYSLVKLISELERIGVDMIYKVAGSPYDVILKLSANSKKDLKKRITNDTVQFCMQHLMEENTFNGLEL